MQRFVGLTRFIVGLGSLTSIIMSALLFIAAAAQIVVILIDVWWLGFGNHETIEAVTIAAVRYADTVLIGAAMLIIGIGLYALFFSEPAKLPEWLNIRTLEDLKDKLVSVIVAVLAVNFFIV